jgi:hypothetical protein
MPGVSKPQIYLPRLLRGPGDRGAVVESSLIVMKGSGDGGDLVPGVFLFNDTGQTVYATADTAASYVVKSVHDQYGLMLPAQYVAKASITSSHYVTAMAIGGLEFEITEDAVTTTLDDVDVGKFARLAVADLSAGAGLVSSFNENPIGVGNGNSWYLVSDFALTTTSTDTTIWQLLGLADGADNPGPAASGLKRNWRVACGNAQVNQ